MLLVAVPATLIGCSLPLFSEYVCSIPRGERPATHSREVYATYAIGAAVSVLLTEYVLVRTIGTTGCARDVAAEISRSGWPCFSCSPTFAVVGFAPQMSYRSRDLGWLRPFAALLILGCASSGFQMVFVRAAMEILGNSREVFALTLALVLVGLPDRRSPGAQSPPLGRHSHRDHRHCARLLCSSTTGKPAGELVYPGHVSLAAGKHGASAGILAHPHSGTARI